MPTTSSSPRSISWPQQEDVFEAAYSTSSLAVGSDKARVCASPGSSGSGPRASSGSSSGDAGGSGSAPPMMSGGGAGDPRPESQARAESAVVARVDRRQTATEFSAKLRMMGESWEETRNPAPFSVKIYCKGVSRHVPIRPNINECHRANRGGVLPPRADGRHVLPVVFRTPSRRGQPALRRDALLVPPPPRPLPALCIGIRSQDRPGRQVWRCGAAAVVPAASALRRVPLVVGEQVSPRHRRR